jgi:hypothetical protein
VWVKRTYFVMRLVATLTFIAVNGAAIDLGSGSTFEDAKEDAARRCLGSLRSLYGVKEGILMRKIPRSRLFKSNSPPSRASLTFDLVDAPERERNGWKSFRLVPVSEEKEKEERDSERGKSSFRRRMQRFWKEMSS